MSKIMPFKQEEVDDLLVSCHRRCCICHRFCCIKIETDHMLSKSENGPDSIDNAIPVCFECHAEIHLYNNKHPRGRKYHAEELKKHKKQWLEICKASPHSLIDHPNPADGGPLTSLITELEFNHVVAGLKGCLFETYQFQHAVSEGILSLLDEELRDAILLTYAQIKLANQKQLNQGKLHPSEYAYKDAEGGKRRQFEEADRRIQESLGLLQEFLSRN
ncbi:MAG: HNH endonuclease [Candidatus Nitrosopolaris sp.]